MRAIFCGNFEYDARQSELERLFRRFGRVERVDMKSGFAFIYMEDERDAEDAIRGLDRTEFGRKGRRLRVEWTKQDRGARRPAGSSRRSSTNSRPSKTLFVINFDPQNTRTKDLERHFEPYGRIANVRIRRNFAFVQYENLEDASKALEATDSSKFMDRVISVEYAVRDDDERGSGQSPDSRHDKSPHRRRRSPSPYRRERASPDYGHAPSPANRRERAGPEYGCRRSPSPYGRDRGSPDYGHGTSRSPYGRERGGSDHGRSQSRSPYRRDRASEAANGRDLSVSPNHKERPAANNGRDSSYSPYRREKANPDGGHSQSPYERDRASPDNGSQMNPNSIAEDRDSSPNGVGKERTLRERYRSESPPADE